MPINIYKDKLLGARLFGASVLYSANPIPREDVPSKWYCYDLRGTARHPDEPYTLVDQTEDCHAGSILSYLPLKSGRSLKKLVKDMFQLTGTSLTLAEFCEDEHIQCPETPIRHMLRPASPEEAGFFYALPPEKDVIGVPAGAQRQRVRWGEAEQGSGRSFGRQAETELSGLCDDEGVIGRVTYASGESEDFTDPQKYLQTIREELPYHPTTGFRCETLTDDPSVRKAVDDMLYDLYGEENPRQLEDYSRTNMTMRGMI